VVFAGLPADSRWQAAAEGLKLLPGQVGQGLGGLVLGVLLLLLLLGVLQLLQVSQHWPADCPQTLQALSEA
jgi:hypothetical protein